MYLERSDCARSHCARSALGLALLLAGCLVGPDYLPPETPAPGAWSATLDGGLSPAALDRERLGTWWTALGDPRLSELIVRAVSGSPDVHAAVARVQEARARIRIARSALFPTLDAVARASRTRSSEATGSGDAHSLYQPGFDATWELDLFGGLRRGVEAAQADARASEEDLRDVLVILAGDVGRSYVDVRTFQARVAIAEDNLASQEQTYEIARWREQAGLTTVRDVEQARTNLEQTRSLIPVLRSGLAQARNRLSVLVGEAPGALAALIDEPGPIPTAPPELAVSVPAEVLRQRPDVRRAERQLAASTARVGVATADRYPSLALVGSIGLEALTPGELFHSGAWTGAMAASAAQLIFDGGGVSGNIEAQEALRQEALAGYRSAVLLALEEVENALVAYREEQTRQQALVVATESAERASLLASDQYNAGLVDFDVVLDAQRLLFSLQDQLASSESEVTANLIRLYKALGGGWALAGSA